MTGFVKDHQTPGIETLSNGMRVILLPSTANTIVAATIFLPVPGAVEREPESGLVGFTNRMLMRGTKALTSSELADAIERLGTSMSCDTNDDFSFAHFVSTSDTFDESLSILSDVLQKPSFEPEEIEKERQSTLAAIRRSEDDKFSLTFKRFQRELYGDHSYGLPRNGTIESVSEFKREQLLDMYSEFYDPGQYLAVCVGNFEADKARAMFEDLFIPSAQPIEKYEAPEPARVMPAHVQFSKQGEQSFLAAGVQACGYLSPDFAAMRVLNTVLGEGMSSRLFIHLRDEHGLAYATGSSYGPMRAGGHVFGYIGTKPESLSFARDAMLEQFEILKRELVPEEELQRAKNYIVGKFLIDHQTNYRRAFYLGFYEQMGLGIEMDDIYPDLISRVTADQVRELAQKYLNDYTIVELLAE